MASKWRLLTSTSNMIEAEILKSALESADITVSLKWESFNAVFFGTSASGPGTQVDVFVLEEDWEEAQAYITYTD